MQRARNQETTEGIRKLSDELAHLGWYHSIELPDGQVIPGLQTIEVLKSRIADERVPVHLVGCCHDLSPYPACIIDAPASETDWPLSACGDIRLWSSLALIQWPLRLRS